MFLPRRSRRRGTPGRPVGYESRSWSCRRSTPWVIERCHEYRSWMNSSGSRSLAASPQRQANSSSTGTCPVAARAIQFSDVPAKSATRRAATSLGSVKGTMSGAARDFASISTMAKSTSLLAGLLEGGEEGLGDEGPDGDMFRGATTGTPFQRRLSVWRSRSDARRA